MHGAVSWPLPLVSSDVIGIFLGVACRLFGSPVAFHSWSRHGLPRKANCCFGVFSKETVGEPFYLLVTTLNQKINKGPVDVITCKALYTLNEDWLLWQVPEFNTVVSLPEAHSIQTQRAGGGGGGGVTKTEPASFGPWEA